MTAALLVFAWYGSASLDSGPSRSGGERAATPPPRPRLSHDWANLPEAYRGQVVLNWKKGYREKTIALTFDDGPDPKVTPRILGALRRANAKATFFVLGMQAEMHPDLVRQIVREGHALGNHTWRHPGRPSPERGAWEVKKTSDLLERLTGSRPALFRPPFGIRDSSSSLYALDQKYAVVLWNVASGDSYSKNPRAVVANIGLNPRPGSIVLMHDGPGKSHTADALPTVLKRLRANGYEIVTVPELMRRWDRFEQAQARPAPQAKAR